MCWIFYYVSLDLCYQLNSPDLMSYMIIQMYLPYADIYMGYNYWEDQMYLPKT